MEKRYAFFLAFLFTLLIGGNYLFVKSGEIFPEREIVIIGRVIDGDTVELEDGRTIRLLNINTPERGKFFSDESTSFLKEFEDKPVELEIEGVGRYGRILGRLYYEEVYINLEIIRLGLAHKYLVEQKELGKFEKVEKEAKENELGIWQKSDHYGCLSVEINKYEEYVIIEDECGVNFESWVIKDESTKSYKFNSLSGRFTLYSEKGIDKDDKIYWGRGKVWNDDKDSIFIRDEEGGLVYYDNYGY